MLRVMYSVHVGIQMGTMMLRLILEVMQMRAVVCATYNCGLAGVGRKSGADREDADDEPKAHFHQSN